MEQLLTVSDVARKLGARPRDISDLLYRRKLRDDLCPIVGGRRLIAEDYLDAVARELKRAGKPIDEAEWRNATERLVDESDEPSVPP